MASEKSDYEPTAHEYLERARAYFAEQRVEDAHEQFLAAVRIDERAATDPIASLFQRHLRKHAGDDRCISDCWW